MGALECYKKGETGEEREGDNNERGVEEGGRSRRAGGGEEEEEDKTNKPRVSYGQRYPCPAYVFRCVLTSL